MLKTIFENLKKIHLKILQKVSFSDFKAIDKNSCYITIVTFHESKGNVQLFDGHIATIKAEIIQIHVKLNCFLVKQILKNYFKPP